MLRKRLSTLLLMVVVVVLVMPRPVIAQAQIEIRFVHIFGGSSDSRAKVLQTIADDFMKANPTIKVTIASTQTDYAEVFQSALLAAEQKNAPHLVQVEEGLTQLAADSGYFVAISDLATKEQLATLDDVLPVVRNYYKISDKTWSLPWNSSNPVVYYNKNMFKTAGLDPEKAPATFADILSACEAIMAKKTELKIDACANWPLAAWFPEQWVAMQGGLIANNDNGRTARATEVLYTSKEMKVVADFYKTLGEKKYFTYSGKPNDYTGEGTTFLSRKTAISINSTAGITLFRNFATLQGVNLGIAPLFKPSADANNGVTVGGASVWITKDHPAPEVKAALDFALYLTSTENDIRWHKGSGYFPNRQSSLTELEKEGWFTKNPAFAISVNQLKESKGNIANSGAVIGPSTDVRSSLVKALQSILAGEDPQKSLEAAKAAADKAITEYNQVVGK
jgi:sn-glycerol 3-phosphate transport system substrate-binding protein